MEERNGETKSALERDLFRNISILGFMANNPVTRVYRAGGACLVLGRSDHLWAYISCDNRDELEALLDQYQFETKYFASIENWMKPVILKDKELEWELVTRRFILPAGVEINQPQSRVTPLTEEDVGYIYQQSNYQQFTSPDYIGDRISRGISAGMRIKGRLVAWGLTHDDDALGFLHVLSAYRRQGLARDIARSLIKQQRARHKPVFVNIEPHNHPSENLSVGMDFVYDREISWLKLR